MAKKTKRKRKKNLEKIRRRHKVRRARLRTSGALKKIMRRKQKIRLKKMARR